MKNANHYQRIKKTHPYKKHYFKILKKKDMQKVYCNICDSSFVLTPEKNEDIFYWCTLCREWEILNKTNREIKDNNFDEKLVLDYSN